MNRRLKSYLSFLDLLCIASAKQKTSLLTTISSAQMQTLCEVIYNVYKGTIPVTKKDINSLLPFKNIIRTLITRSVNQSRRKRLLLKHQKVIPHLIKPALKYFQDGPRASTRPKRKIPKSAEIGGKVEQPRGEIPSTEGEPSQ